MEDRAANNSTKYKTRKQRREEARWDYKPEVNPISANKPMDDINDSRKFVSSYYEINNGVITVQRLVRTGALHQASEASRELPKDKAREAWLNAFRQLILVGKCFDVKMGMEEIGRSGIGITDQQARKVVIDAIAELMKDGSDASGEIASKVLTSFGVSRAEIENVLDLNRMVFRTYPSKLRG